MQEYRINRIKKATIKKPYIYSFIIISLLYLIINFIVNEHSITAPTFFKLNSLFVTFFILFQLSIAFLVAININLIILTIKETPRIGESGLTVFGIAGGLLGGACPGCLAGLMPAFIGLFGISSTLIKLPLYVLELQAFSVLLLILGLFLLTRPVTCEIPEAKK